MRVRSILVSGLLATFVLSACGPAPDRVGPNRDRLQTDDLARAVLAATAEALRVPEDDVSGLADARRCDDRATARHQVDASFDVPVTNRAVARDDLVRAFSSAGVPFEESTDDAGFPVLTGTESRSSYEVVIGPEEQVVTVRSECLDVGRVQAVEVGFAERYRVRLGEDSPER
jgi:hypothetical protein